MGARYSKQQGYTVSQRAKATRSTIRTTKQKVSFGPTTARFFGLAVLAILALVLLTQSSTNATSAYKQTALRTKFSQAEQDVERLQLEAIRAKSIQAIEQSPVKDTMEPVKKTEFIEKGDVAGVSTDKQP